MKQKTGKDWRRDAERNQRILNDWRAGKKQSDIAAEQGCSRPNISRLISRELSRANNRMVAHG